MRLDNAQKPHTNWGVIHTPLYEISLSHLCFHFVILFCEALWAACLNERCYINKSKLKLWHFIFRCVITRESATVTPAGLPPTVTSSMQIYLKVHNASGEIEFLTVNVFLWLLNTTCYISQHHQLSVSSTDEIMSHLLHESFFQ